MNLNDVLNLYSTQLFWLCEKMQEEYEKVKKEHKKLMRKNRLRR